MSIQNFVIVFIKINANIKFSFCIHEILMLILNLFIAFIKN